MSDKDDKSGSIDAAHSKEEALRLKALAEEKYNSGDLNSAVAYAERARDLHPSISGLHQMLTAFQILRAAAASPIPGGENQKPTPDYYMILQVQRFSHINSIKKQYKKLALTLHPDKNPFVASEEAFKLVGEAARVLSDKIRRKEYDVRLRVAMQSEAAGAVAVEIGEEGSRETFRTACSACQLLHQFERKYLGHNLVCPGCMKTFKAVEAEERNGDEGKNEKSEANTRVSARIRERVSKGDYVGSVEKFGLGVKRRNNNLGEVSEGLGVKMARTGVLKRSKRVEDSGDGHGVENGRFKKMETLINGGKEAMESGEVEIVENEMSKRGEGREEESMTLSQMQMMVKKKKPKKKVVVGKLTTKAKKVNAEKLRVNGVVGETEKDGEGNKEDLGEEESAEEMEDVMIEEMAKERGGEAEKEKVVNLRGNSNRRRVPKIRNLEAVHAASRNYFNSEIEKDTSSDKGNSEVPPVEKEKEMDVIKEKKGRRRVPKFGNSDILSTKSSKNHVDSDLQRLNADTEGDLGFEKDISSENGESEVLLVEKEKEMDVINEKKGRRRVPKFGNSNILNTKSSKNRLDSDLHRLDADTEGVSEIEKDISSEKGVPEVLLMEKEKEKEIDVIKENKGRRRVPKYGNLDILNTKSSNNGMDLDFQRVIANKKGDLEIMAVDDSDFHDFDKDRRERSFKKGQVWALYDDVDAMPRHYALINEIVSVNPFEVTLSWLMPQNNEDEESISRLKNGYFVSCGSFRVTRRVTIRYLNLFSHLVDCERAARELYRIYPKKGSVWAIYSSSGREAEESDEMIEGKRCYNIVVTLSSYSDVHGLSIAYLKKVEGFRTVFNRRGIGANAVVCLGAKDIKIFSHQIPSKKLFGEEASGLPKGCWELDPASLTPQLLSLS
ncbi:uncharacterized protein LOC125213750 [Salvia hispanica]|uniref:uncharacterized protein LOC125213750 n=1 Tax=Salvia hispanica TaxID=49212 RepID=UPI0020092939|nr:uncharacterized protein LOC125213750 [Salvia hispanica]